MTNITVDEKDVVLLSNLVITVGSKQCSLSWDPVNDSELFCVSIYRHTSDVLGSATKIIDVQGNHYVDLGLSNGSNYYYWIRAVNIYNQSNGPYEPAANGILGVPA